MTAPDGAAHPEVERAAAAYRVLLAHFSLAGVDRGLLAERYPPEQPGQPRIAFLWPYSQALEADLSISRLAGAGSRAGQELPRRLAALGRYWRPEPEPPGYQSTVMPALGPLSDLFYDDNLWVALALIEHGRLTGGDEHVSRARAIFRLIESGWDRDGRHPAPGGVFWVRADWSRDRNTVSTAPASKLASHLYELTGDENYLDWALRLYAWVERELRAPNGLYWDHVDLASRIEQT